MDSCSFAFLPHFRRSPYIDVHHPRFAVSIAAIAAPGSLLRFLHQSALHRVAVNVTQLLDPLVLAPHLKVINLFGQTWIGRRGEPTPPALSCGAAATDLARNAQNPA